MTYKNRLTSLSLPPSSFYNSVLNVYNELNKSNYGVCDPKPVKDAVGEIESRFRGFSQQVKREKREERRRERGRRAKREKWEREGILVN